MIVVYRLISVRNLHLSINFDPDLYGYNYSYTFYNCPCINIDGYKYLDNDCNCEFNDGDSVLEDWPIIISAGFNSQNSDMQGFIAEVYTESGNVKKSKDYTKKLLEVSLGNYPLSYNLANAYILEESRSVLRKLYQESKQPRYKR